MIFGLILSSSNSVKYTTRVMNPGSLSPIDCAETASTVVASVAESIVTKSSLSWSAVSGQLNERTTCWSKSRDNLPVSSLSASSNDRRAIFRKATTLSAVVKSMTMVSPLVASTIEINYCQ
jgi:hypothetical protein